MYFSFSSSERRERNGRKAICDKISISESAALAFWKPISTVELTFRDLCPSLLETLPLSLKHTPASDTLLANKSLLLGSLGELSVFPGPSPFLPICSCEALLLIQPFLGGAHRLWMSPFLGVQAVPKPDLSWNWSKNGTNNKAELWFTSKLRVEKGK